MNAALWIFLAFAFAVIIFTGFQNDLPEELGFLKNTKPNTVFQLEAPGPTANGEGMTTSQYQGWTIRKTPYAVEFVRTMSANIEVNGNQYSSPEFGLLCDGGKLDIRIDTRTGTTGRTSTPVTVSGLGAQEWDKSSGKNIFPKNAAALLAHLNKTPKVEFTLSYSELGLQKATLDTTAFAQLLQALPATCR